jgi:hypothetical protein
MVLVALDAGNIHLDFDDAGIDTIHSGAKSFVKHKRRDTFRAFTLAYRDEERL